MLIGPLVPIASCQIAVAPGGWRGCFCLEGKRGACFLLLLDLGFAGFRLAWGTRSPSAPDSRREGLASGSSLLGEVWAQSPWLSAAPLRLLNLLLTAGKWGGRKTLPFLGVGPGCWSPLLPKECLPPLSPSPAPWAMGDSHLEAGWFF